MSRNHVYPPSLSHDQLTALVTEIKDWQITHGSLIKLVHFEEPSTVPTCQIGVSAFPTPFPASLYEQAQHLQPIFNKLYVAVSEDEVWLYDVLQNLIKSDALVSILWYVYMTVAREGVVQNLAMGIFRSDYMLHSNKKASFPKTVLKQVEFNAYSCAGGTHSNIAAEIHRHLQRTGRYDDIHRGESGEPGEPVITTSAMPPNPTVEGLISALSAAHSAYGPPKSPRAKKTCILFVVQPNNVNIADERPLEYGLWDAEIPTFRIRFDQEILAYTDLDDDRNLLYHPPWRPSETFEVSVVYMRAGYEAAEYDSVGSYSIGRDARLQLERSHAIKCPPIICHLATLKKVQEVLSKPGELEKFLSADEAAQIRRCDMPMYPLDESPAGLTGRSIATQLHSAKDYVLKPSLEGGGHNVYRKDIPDFLASIPMDEWHQYILMKMISPPSLDNILISSEGVYRGSVVSELGIFGTCMWRVKRTRERDEEKPEMLANNVGGWSLKTKREDVDEMSVIKGYGCFDSPLLVSSVLV